MSVTLSDEEFAVIRGALRLIANGHEPNGKGWVKMIWAHKLRDIAREVCERHGWTYDLRSVHGLSEADRPTKRKDAA